MKKLRITRVNNTFLIVGPMEATAEGVGLASGSSLPSEEAVGELLKAHGITDESFNIALKELRDKGEAEVTF